MDGKQYIEMISKKAEDAAKIKKIEETYKTSIPGILRKIVSNCDETVFLDDEKRVLSFDEIIDAERDLHTEFIKKGLLPVVDNGENDFTVFRFSQKNWSKYNIIDEVEFKVKDTIEELL